MPAEFDITVSLFVVFQQTFVTFAFSNTIFVEAKLKTKWNFRLDNNIILLP